MAPELCGLIENVSIETLTDQDHFAVDIWALGEIACRMLTGKPAFPTIASLVSYAQRPTMVPSSAVLDTYTSATGSDFVHGLLRAQPSTRPKVAAAISHDWIQQREPPNLPECNPVRESSEQDSANSDDASAWWTTSSLEDATVRALTAHPELRSTPCNSKFSTNEPSASPQFSNMPVAGDGFQLTPQPSQTPETWQSLP